jgi:hypothetical protein
MFNIGHSHSVPWFNHSAPVHSTEQLNAVFPSAAVVNELELADVTILLHHTQNLPHQLGGGPNDAFPFMTTFVVMNRVQRIRERIN